MKIYFFLFFIFGAPLVLLTPLYGRKKNIIIIQGQQQPCIHTPSPYLLVDNNNNHVLVTTTTTSYQNMYEVVEPLTKNELIASLVVLGAFSVTLLICGIIEHCSNIKKKIKI